MKLNENAPKNYGLERINPEETVYVVEGPFDSTFVENSVAFCGSDGNMAHLEGSSIVYVYDNEPRNQEILGRIEQCIDRGEQVVLWPRSIEEKDINDMVLANYDIMDILKSNTYSGLEAKVNFNNWKKV